MIKKTLVLLLFCVFLESCSTISPRTDIQINVADDATNINSIYIGLNAQQLPAAFADSLQTSLKSMFQENGISVVVKRIVSDDELASFANTNADYFSHIMFIKPRQIEVNRDGEILDLMLNITLIDAQKDIIVMRANVQVYRGRNESLETVFTNKPILEMGAEEGRVAVIDLIFEMRASGLLSM